MEGGDHLLALPDAHLAPGGVSGVAALRDVEVGGVVAPVVLPGQRTALVHAAKIKDGHELDVRDAQPLEIIQAGGVDAVGVQGGALLGKGQIFAPPGRADAAGRVLGEIPDVDLPHRAVGGGDIRAVVMQPARWVDSGKIGDHAPLAVHARRSGVGVGGFPAGAPGVEGIGVVAAVLIAGEVDRPEPLPPLFQREGADADPAVAPAVEVDIHLPGRGCPQPQAGAGRGVFHPQRAGIGVLLRKSVTLKQRFPIRRCSGVHGCSFPFLACLLRIVYLSFF